MNPTQLIMFDEPSTIAEDKVYLWVNILDIDTLGNIGLMGSPFFLLINADLGDNLLPGAVFHPNKLDDSFLIIETSQERANAISEVLIMMGKHKMKRKVRTRITVNPPNDSWQRVNG